MTKTIITSLICAIVTFAAMADDKSNEPTGPDFEIMMLATAPRPSPMFLIDGPMMPPPMHMRHGFNNRPDFDWQSQINLTDEQREKFQKLGKKHHKEIKQLQHDRAAMHEKYQEKFEEVLTDEQFRKIEKMRKELRRDMKKLDEKQRDLFEQHRNDFESILTKQQRQQLYKMREDKTSASQK